MGVLTTKAHVDGERFVRPTELSAHLEECDIATSIECGLRMEMFTADVDGHKLSVNSGGGCGSPWITMNYRGRNFRMDMRPVATELVCTVDTEEDSWPVVGGVSDV